MTEPTPEPNLSKKILKLFLVLLLGFILVGIYLNYQRAQRVEQLLQQYKQSGYSTSLKEINEKYVLPPSNENGALAIESALKKLKDPKRNFDPIAKKDNDYIINSTNYSLLQKILPGETIPEEVKTAISEHLSQNEEILKLLNQASVMRQFRYCPDYTLGIDAKIPPLLGMRKATTLFQLKTLLYLENGQYEEAIQSVIDGVVLLRSLSYDPMLIVYTVQTSLIQISIESLEHLFSRTAVSEKNLLALSSLLQELEEPQALERCFVTKFCMDLDVFNKKDGYYENSHMDYIPGLKESDKIYYLERMKMVIDVYATPIQNHLKEVQKLKNLEEEIHNSSRFFHGYSQSQLTPFHRLYVAGVQRIVDLRNAQIALAIERYRLANQKLPEQLSELAPAYIKAELLVDLFDQSPIRYKKLEKGYLIYSVGEDMNDQGGKKREQKSKEWDLVFTVNR